MKRRAWLKTAATAACAVVGPLYLLSTASQAQEPVLRVAMIAGKFAFVPGELRVKKGSALPWY